MTTESFFAKTDKTYVMIVNNDNELKIINLDGKDYLVAQETSLVANRKSSKSREQRLSWKGSTSSTS